MVKKTTINRREILHHKMFKKGITAKDALKFTRKQWKDAFGTKKLLKKDSLEAQKKLIKQIGKNQSQVLKHSFKKRGIENKAFRNFMRKETRRLWKKVPTKPPEEIDLKVNGSVHKKQITIHIKTRKELKEFIEDIHGSGWSPKYKGIFDKSKLVKIYNVYSEFDYGEPIHV